MRIICDAPGQTCNRLWTYVSSVAQCIAEKKKMVILFFDWTIEDFPNLLHCPFIYFPLWNKWYLERGNGWNNYKGLTWKITHDKRWDKIFKFLGCTKGWSTRTDARYLSLTKKELQNIFRPKVGHLTLYSNDEGTNTYYKEIIPGYQDYREVLTIHKQTFFDEYGHKGTADKWKDCRPQDSFLDWQFDNVSIPKQSYAMNSLTRGWKQILFEHIGSKLYMLRFKDGKLEKKESLYAHFQHRPFMKDQVKDYDHFLITPGNIIDFPNHFTMPKLRFYSRKRELMTKYYQWKDRVLWKIGKGHIR